MASSFKEIRKCYLVIENCLSSNQNNTDGEPKRKKQAGGMLSDSLGHILPESFKEWSPHLADPEQFFPRLQVLQKTMDPLEGAILVFEISFKK